MKVTATVNVRGVDAAQMMVAAREKLAELSTADWKLTEVSVNNWMEDAAATRDGMLPMWSGSVTAEADVKEA